MNDVYHDRVVSTIKYQGRLTTRYIFMMMVSTGIATIGLIINSAVIVIGAMLISPLMSPIMLFGFSLCTVDYNQLKISVKAIICGLLIAISVSAILTKISPIHQITDQIMSRTNPSLYDLLIAIFSGLAGVYTIITRKGEEIIGVALATSILPPLSVVGFGIAIGDFNIAEGAAFLFITNLLAIAVSTTILAKWYGFGFHNSTAQTFWQVFMTLAIFITLSIPLGITLNKIASQTQDRNIIQSTINKYFIKNKDLNFIRVLFTNDKGINIRAVVFTDAYNNVARDEILHSLGQKIKQKITLRLEQVIYEQGLHPEATQYPLSEKQMESKLQDEILFPVHNISINHITKIVYIYPAHSKNLDVIFLYENEQNIAYKFPGWKIKIYPHVIQIPSLYFMVDQINLTQQEERKLQIIEWMLKRWETYDVEVVGFADKHEQVAEHNQDSIVWKRINYIIKKLKTASISAKPVIAYDKESVESKYGIANSQKIQIRPQGKISDLYGLQNSSSP